ncbi:MAG: hypothetical protein OXT01_20805 [Rhodospirillaceae bacterium]|nr:hypothetical protein [Rhodospirillaceae bacterium]
MTAIRVFILTTDGPVEIQRITEEDPGVKSVICLDGKAVALPVSPAYEAFVRSPTGVIESCFGHPAYRLDVSGRISEGLSWQFGVFLAHALHKAGRLDGSAADVAVLTTGEIDRDLNVLSVDAVAEKLMLAQPLLDSLVADGVATTILVPQDNAEAAADGSSLAPVASVAQAFTLLGLDLPEKTVPVQVATASDRPRSSAVPILTIAALLIAGIGAAWWLVERDRKPVVASSAQAEATTVAAVVPTVETPAVKPAPVSASPQLLTTLVERRAPPGKSCAAVHFDAAAPRIVERSVANSGQFAETPLRGLCGLVYRVTNKGPAIDLTVLAARAQRGAETVRTKVFLRNQRLAQGERAELEVKPPRVQAPVRLQFLLLAATDLASRRPEAQRRVPKELPIERWRATPAKVAAYGYSVFTVSHPLTP